MTTALLLPPTKRWYPLRPHPVQSEVWRSEARYIVLPAGRRSGKTELAKRRLIRRACAFHAFPDGWFVFGCPTYAQAKRIYWRDLNAMVPKRYIASVERSELSLTLINGAKIQLMGLDEPARIEGPPLDGIVLDEYANMKPGTWDEHVAPALDTPDRPGWAMFIGVPESGTGNDYRSLFENSTSGKEGWEDWAGFTWESASVLDEAAIRSAKARLDRRTFDQEYRGKFVDLGGRVYYDFGDDSTRRCRCFYNPVAPLLLSLDFNIAPGTAAASQHFVRPADWPETTYGPKILGTMGEVWIESGSNTKLVMEALIEDWGKHAGFVHFYGDATGGAEGTAKLEGSDWDIVRRMANMAWPGRVKMRVPEGNPRERVRVNCMNSLIMATDGVRRYVADPDYAPHVVDDMRRVSSKPGTNGAINKDIDKKITHLSDGLGYLVCREHPVADRFEVSPGY